MLHFSQPDLDAKHSLAEKLGRKLADYIQFRRKKIEDFQIGEGCVMREVIPYDRIPWGVKLDSLSLNSQLQVAGWHVQVHLNGAPRFYARTTFDDNLWAIKWIGEGWLARHIRRGLHWVEDQEANAPDSKVRLLSSRLFMFSSLYLVEDRRHVVVSRSKKLRSALPRFRWLTEDELAGRLLDHFGPSHGRGGIAPKPN